MSTPTDRSTRPTSWVLPGTAVVCGLAYLIAGLARGATWFAWFGFALMVAIAIAIVVLGRYSETVRGLADRRDERINSIDRDATLFAGAVLLLAVLAMFFVELARGLDGSPYMELAALSGASYLAALIWLRLRR